MFYGINQFCFFSQLGNGPSLQPLAKLLLVLGKETSAKISELKTTLTGRGRNHEVWFVTEVPKDVERGAMDEKASRALLRKKYRLAVMVDVYAMMGLTLQVIGVEEIRAAGMGDCVKVLVSELS
jgi:hypothetical protein